jgi:hypothetical protein
MDMDWKDNWHINLQVLKYPKEGWSRRDVMLIRAQMANPRAWAYKETRMDYQLIFRPDLAERL